MFESNIMQSLLTFEFLMWLFISLILILLCFVFVIYVTSDTYPKVQIDEAEKTVENDAGKLENFPNLDDNASLELSVIVPAYNEEERLPKMLEECVSYLEENFANKFEIIIVDDGSKDATSKTVLEWSRGLGKFIHPKCYKTQMNLKSRFLTFLFLGRF